MKAHPAQRGAALIATLALAAIVMPAVGHVLLEVRLESLVRANLVAQTQTLYAAEAGLAGALAHVASVGTLAAIEHGPDQQPGTADDGRLPALVAPGWVLTPEYRFELGVRRIDAETVELAARGAGPRQTQCEVTVRARFDQGRLVTTAWRRTR